MSMPRISEARAKASSGFAAALIPPALPRPPTCTWALTTTVPPSSAAAALASSGVRATRPAGTGTPTVANRDFPWYSNRSTSFPSALRDVCLDPGDHVGQRGARGEDPRQARRLQYRDVGSGDDPAPEPPAAGRARGRGKRDPPWGGVIRSTPGCDWSRTITAPASFGSAVTRTT